MRRARRVVNALLGFAVSDGWVAGLRAQAAGLLTDRFLPHVRALIAAAPVAHADETVRHEAPCDRVEVRGLHRRAVAAAG